MGLTAGEITAKYKAELRGQADFVVDSVGDPKSAQTQTLCFVSSREYLPAIKESPAQCWIIDKKLYDQLEEDVRQKRNFILTDKPYLIFTQVIQEFFPPEKAKAGISDQAFVHPTAKVDANVQIDPFAFVGANAKIASGVVLKSGVYIGESVEVGQDTYFHAGVKIYANSKIGKRCIFHCGAVIGSDGFGYVNQPGVQLKVPHIGRVVIHDDVEVGANSCIDRGTLGDTVIGSGTKMDNLVQIGHNCIIGKNCTLCAFVGLSGNTIVGDNVVFGGQTATKGHMKIGNNVMIAGQSGVINDLEDGSVVKGYPTQPLKQFLKNHALYLKLPEIYKRLQALEKKLGL